jgi:hypothetical protein
VVTRVEIGLQIAKRKRSSPPMARTPAPSSTHQKGGSRCRPIPVYNVEEKLGIRTDIRELRDGD